MNSTWTANYNGNEIRIENSWFDGERLFVNGKLQDERYSIFSANLTGHIKSTSGEKLNIKVNMGGFIKVECHLFIDDEKIEAMQLR